MDIFKMKNNYVVLGFIGLGLISLLFFAFPSKYEIKENEGILTLTFDDGLKSQYEIAFKEMQKYEQRGSLFLVANWTGLFEGKELMTFEEVKEMYDNGWEIGSHSLTYNFHNRLTKISDEELENELKKSKEILEEKGFEIKTFAFPFGDYDSRVIEKTKRYYSASKPMEKGFNPTKEANFYELKTQWVLNKHDSKEVCGWIKKAKEDKSWLIISFHNIGEEKTPWDFSEQKFKEVLECINNEGIQIKTIKEVLEYEKRN